MRNGTTCSICGTELFDWQEDEFDVLPGLCPECAMEFNDYFGDEAEDMLDAVGLF